MVRRLTIFQVAAKTAPAQKRANPANLEVMSMRNRRWVLAAHAAKEATEDTWKMVEDDLPRPGVGQILIKTQWLSVDPYMRGRLNPPSPGAAGMQIGDLMQGGGVGEVIASNHPAWNVGDIAEGLDVGWQEYSVLTPDLP